MCICREMYTLAGTGIACGTLSLVFLWCGTCTPGNVLLPLFDTILAPISIICLNPSRQTAGVYQYNNPFLFSAAVQPAAIAFGKIGYYPGE